MLIFCILNLTFSLVATYGNLLVIRALWKASSIPATLKKFFLSLAASDLAVGLVGQLTFGVVIAVMLKMAGDENYDFNFFCPTILTVRYFSLVFLAFASFWTVTAIAVDRLLAIFLHLRYQELVTPRRVVIAVASLWLGSGVAASTFIVLPVKNTIVIICLGFVGFAVTTAAYICIYKVVRYHRTQLQAQAPDVSSMTFLREAKSAISALFVYIVFLVCYVPYLCTLIMLTTDRFRMSFLLANHVTFFLTLLNSSLNPLIYCWRYGEVRKIVASLVKAKFCFPQTEP